jgi:hypothetical protein
MNNKTFLVIAVVVVVVVGLGFFLTRSGPDDAVEVIEPDPIVEVDQNTLPPADEPDALPEEPAAESTDVADATDAAATAEPEGPEFSFPETRGLDNSDDFLDEVMADKKNLPAVKQTTDSQHVVRRGVTAVDRVLRGENPNRQLNFLQPAGKTETELKGNKVYLSQKNYQRYEPLVDSLEEMDSRYLVALYRHLSPMLVTAYDELGYGDQAWEVKVSQFISKVLAVKVPEGPVELLGSDGVFIFADEKLENLPAFEKAFIRMGPENTKRVQRKFRQIRQTMREM